MLSWPMESRRMSICVAFKRNRWSNLSIFNFGWFDFISGRFLLDIQYVFRFRLLAIVGIADAAITSSVLRLNIRDNKTVALLLEKEEK